MIPSTSVLVVVDVQNGFIRPPSAPVVPVIAGLVKRWQQEGGAVVFTRYLNYPGSPFERMIHWQKLQDSPEIDIVPDLAQLADKSITLDKRIYSLFSPEGIRLVREKGWSDLYICGIATESCVLKTAVDAFELNLTPWVLSDASASHAGQEAHDAGMLVIRRFIGEGQIIRVSDVPLSDSAVV
ncbi:cysteine hydrolase family protein [Pseudosporangium ferrugineum]|uniref:Nicotinamidase-related amidase n=1 Tax=Pseudosporangium ferrugineum TaxID=439699 RepID=A0A2T0S3M4_9ACTN|nr:isochorismatase family cysteine hydrolase [Pseudosporangium ferrugineum]PRY28028.1 nicotinamidase-related amidase [Pseudosporangium ferrugineum]